MALNWIKGNGEEDDDEEYAYIFDSFKVYVYQISVGEWMYSGFTTASKYYNRTTYPTIEEAKAALELNLREFAQGILKALE